MIKSLVFLGGAAAGFTLASGMTEEQRSTVKTKASGMTRRLSKGERSQRLASAVTHTKDSVADAAVSVVETAADKVSTVTSKVDSSVPAKSMSNGLPPKVASA